MMSCILDRTLYQRVYNCTIFFHFSPPTISLGRQGLCRITLLL